MTDHRCLSTETVPIHAYLCGSDVSTDLLQQQPHDHGGYFYVPEGEYVVNAFGDQESPRRWGGGARDVRRYFLIDITTLISPSVHSDAVRVRPPTLNAPAGCGEMLDAL
jgi:hypothetical protein